MSVTSKSREEILEHLRLVLSDQFELEPGRIVPEANLYTDLDLDSIDAVDLAVRVEERTGLSLDEADLKSIQTIQDIVDLIDERL